MALPTDALNTFYLNDQPVTHLLTEIQQLYQADHRPWVIGFSGGKDSTLILELVYFALLSLPIAHRHKPLFVVSSDTLVETPRIVDLIKNTLQQVEQAAHRDQIPLTTHLVYPETKNTFWVNLLGKGYPAPTSHFRWCTERLKILPINRFILHTISRYQEVIIILGSRSQESASRAQILKKHRIQGLKLSKHTTLSKAYIYTPIENWSLESVWEFLLTVPKPWGGNNQELFELYKDSQAGECPLVIDNSTPSCGNSRFGCWVCTVVKRDRAMEGLIDRGENWMQPLLDFRNHLAHTTLPEKKHTFRNFKRRSGKVAYPRSEGQLETDPPSIKHVPGPYWLKYRQQWLRELLTLQQDLRQRGHAITLITEAELHHIRWEWANDPNEPDWTDILPGIYREIVGQDLEWVENDAGHFTKPDAELLAELEREFAVPAILIMKLLELELSMEGLSKRTGIFQKIETILTQDWGSLEEINHRNAALQVNNRYEQRVDMLQRELKKWEL